MHFDARTAKQLQPDQHIMVDGCPGLRLTATATTRTWTCRYKSPIDGRMRQKAIGRWPAMSLGAAVAAWEKLRGARDAGIDPARAHKEERAQLVAKAKQERAGVYTVRRLVDDYLKRHIDVHRKEKGAAEVRRLFDRNLGDLAPRQASCGGPCRRSCPTAIRIRST